MTKFFFKQFLPLLNLQVWIFPSVLSIFLIFISFNNYLLFHTLAELFAIAVAVMMFIVAIYTYDYSRNHFLTFLATGYFWIAALDLIHTLVYKGMSVYPFDSLNIPTQFWIVARYSEALLLLLAPLFIRRPINRQAYFIGFGLIFLVLYLLVLNGGLPDTFIEGEGLTSFKVNSEYIICVIFLLALGHLYYKQEQLRPGIFPFLAISIFATICAELAFTFYIDVYGFSNLIGHIFKLFSFWLIFYSIIRISLQEPYEILESLVSKRTRELEQSMQQLNKAEEIAHLGSWNWDITNNKLYWSDEVYRVFGVKPQEFQATYESFLSYIHNKDRNNVQQAVKDALNNKQAYDIEHRIVRKDGQERIVLEKGEVIFDEKDEPLHMVGIIHDVTEQKLTEHQLARVNRELRQLSLQDALTGIANRRMFDQIIQKELERANRNQQQLSLMMIDIDYFKLYNDSYGHLAGDDCLKKVASVLTNVAKRPADLVARFGGEEFVILLPESENDHANYLAELCCDSVKEQKISHRASKVAHILTISAGVASVMPTPNLQVKELIELADKALYEAKEGGRNKFISYKK